jgi:hypothetical protein
MTFISMHSVIICVVFSGAYMRCTRLCSLNPGVTKDQLEYHGSLYLNNIPLQGISTIWSLSRLTQMISNEDKSKGNRNTHKNESYSNNMHLRQESTRSSTAELQLKEVLKSLSQ